MKKITNNNIKLAVQKDGRLTADTLQFLRSAGLEFETYDHQLFSVCRNFPLKILYMRDDDIPKYVASGTADLGIVGQNLIYEKENKVKELLTLGFSVCSLVLAAPREFSFKNLSDLSGRKIATSYPRSVQRFLNKNRIPAEMVEISGAVELTPSLDVADAIADLVSTGSTLALNDLEILEKIYDSEAVLISGHKGKDNSWKRNLVDKLLIRFTGVLSARRSKYVMLNAPENILSSLKQTVPGLKSPTVSSLAKDGWISVQSVVQEDIFWETVDKLRSLGAQDILVLPIEKLIT